MVMDWLRIPVETVMRLDPNSDALTKVRWFRADKGAKLFEDFHYFASTLYDREDDDYPGFTPNRGLGEQGDAPRHYAGGANKHGLVGDHYCGLLRQFQGDIRPTDPALILGPDGVPLCCRVPNQVSEGGTGEGGSGFAFVASFIGQGGTAEGGTAGRAAGMLVMAGGSAEGHYSWILSPPMSITITTEAGTPLYAGIGWLELDNEAGDLTQPAPGRARYLLRDASAEVRGLVNTDFQHFAGPKVFDDGVVGLGGVGALGTLSVGDNLDVHAARFMLSGGYDYTNPLPLPGGTPNPFDSPSDTSDFAVIPTTHAPEDNPTVFVRRLYVSRPNSAGAPNGPFFQISGQYGSPVFVCPAGALAVQDAGGSVVTGASLNLN